MFADDKGNGCAIGQHLSQSSSASIFSSHGALWWNRARNWICTFILNVFFWKNKASFFFLAANCRTHSLSERRYWANLGPSTLRWMCRSTRPVPRRCCEDMVMQTGVVQWNIFCELSLHQLNCYDRSSVLWNHLEERLKVFHPKEYSVGQNWFGCICVKLMQSNL